MSYTNFYNRKRKGMVYMSKIYRKSIDGEFREQDYFDRKRYSNRDRKYVVYRIEDEIRRETGSIDMDYDTFDVTDDIYACIIWVQKDSKKCDILRRLGFTEKDEEES